MDYEMGSRGLSESQEFFLSTSKEMQTLPGLITMDRYFKVPLSYENRAFNEEEPTLAQVWRDEAQDPELWAPFHVRKIRIFAKHLIASENFDKIGTFPWAIFFQGGPGFESPHIVSRSGWLKAMLANYQILLLDQRGTGLSSAITAQALSGLVGASDKADYLRHFRTESIVRDAEEIRKLLLAHSESADKRWTLLGQSFGGFCSFHYLSVYPKSVKSAFTTGGIPPMVNDPDQVYRNLYHRVIEMNKRFYEKYPEDEGRVHEIVQYIKSQEVPIQLPNGGFLTLRRFQQLGLFLGIKGGFDQLHSLILLAFTDYVAPGSISSLNTESSLFLAEPKTSDKEEEETEGSEEKGAKALESKTKENSESSYSDVNACSFSYRFLNTIQNILPFETNPIYAILHESIYCQGAASRWSAQRVINEAPFKEIFEYDPNRAFYFTGEMVYDWMFEDYSQLRPLKGAAHILAQYTGWCKLYDSKVLSQLKIPVSCAVYYDDMYVDFDLSLQAIRDLPTVKAWITNDHLHSAIRDNGEEVLNRLFNLHTEPIL